MTSPKTLITAHIGADFDAFGSIIAASKIYSDSWLVWPGTTDDHLNHFVQDTLPSLKGKHFVSSFEEIPEKEWKKIETLVVVDTRKFSRLKHIQSLLDWFQLKPNESNGEKEGEKGKVKDDTSIKRKNGLKIIGYDHHPPTAEDLPCDPLTYKEWGSASSILTMEIAKMNGDFVKENEKEDKKKIEISGEEATWISLGIYQDTGNFTYSNTTRFDLEAASYLRKVEGFNSDFIFEYLNGGKSSSSSQMWELDEGMLSVYASLASSAKNYQIGEEEIVIAEVNSEEYVNNFATLVQGLAEKEDIENLFCIGRLSDRCVIVGRSRSKESVNVGFFCKFFGGGGHHCAASASIKNLTPFQIKQQLMGHLKVHLGGFKDKKVSDYMIQPALYVNPLDSAGKALELFQKNPKVKRLIVLNEERENIGWIDRSITESSEKGKENSIQEFIHPQSTFLLESDSIDSAIQLISTNQSVIPVYDTKDKNRKLNGVITRKDLEFMEESSGSSPLFPSQKKSILSHLTKSYPEYSRFLEKFSKFLESKGKLEGFVIGRFVREVLMERRRDIDECFPVILLDNEQDPIKISKEFVSQNDEFKQTEEEGTVFIRSKGIKVQVFSSKFPKEGEALSYLKNETQSMDFTIDSLAFDLNAERFGEIIDDYGGEKDINMKTVQVIHSSSFEDNPNRIVMALLLEIDLDFSLGKQTEKLIRSTMSNSSFDQLFKQSSFSATFKKVLDHPKSFEILKSMEKRFHLLGGIHNSLKQTYQEGRLVRICEVLDAIDKLQLPIRPLRWKAVFLTLVEKLKDAEVDEIMNNIGFPKDNIEDIREMRVEFREVIGKLKKWNKESEKKEEKDSFAQLSQLIGDTKLEPMIEIIASQREYQNIILCWLFGSNQSNHEAHHHSSSSSSQKIDPVSD
eukprot:TRINITY_DN3174_c0_g1_i1.p1 TRINITY_DN3174_c0_g1~~TRINITY_DN3174_c0_g1_i1.p1  ORF type:complete len:908 (-),score=277.05 TRINITY_DN3174_c0_g1_i1:19-2742(-)